jgi:hypothetical protein
MHGQACMSSVYKSSQVMSPRYAMEVLFDSAPAVLLATQSPNILVTFGPTEASSEPVF